MSSKDTPAGFPRSFYIANIMEIFERIAWYGFFAVSSLYMSGSVESGGLGLDEQQRGALQGIIPFFVYLLPVVTGAISDRVGYRRMFLIAYVILTPSYFLLGQMKDFWFFFGVYMLVALGAAIFKPLVVGTVARSSNDGNRGRAFGIFYMMVNIGGVLGPLIAGIMRSISWDYVFLLSTFAIGINLLIALFLFEDEGRGEKPAGKISDAFVDVGKVIGNLRFILLVVPVIFGLMLAGGEWISWKLFGIAFVVWGGLQILWDLRARRDNNAPWFSQKLRVGNGTFLIYLLVLSVFWMGYNQIFLTLPLYVRDFVDTSDVVMFLSSISPGLAETMAPVNLEILTTALSDLSTTISEPQVALQRLYELQVRPDEAELLIGLQSVADGEMTARMFAEQMAAAHRQISPEFILAIDFLMIVLFQYLVSRWLEGKAPFMTLIAGTALIGGAYVVGGLSHAVSFGGVLIMASTAVFATGEMFASPKSQEYVASVMPKEQAALFMGFYFVSMAIGFLGAGILSGWAYDLFAIEMQRPFLMWVVFGGLSAVTMLLLFLFNKFLAPGFRHQEELGEVT